MCQLSNYLQGGTIGCRSITVITPPMLNTVQARNYFNSPLLINLLWAQTISPSMILKIKKDPLFLFALSEFIL